MNKSYTVLFGLTADPIHLGHEQAIINGIDYLRQNRLDIKEFVLLPVYQPNLITDKKAPVASYEHRLTMCKIVGDRLSNQLNCAIRVSQIEKEWVDRTGEKNYSINTIKAIVENNVLIGEIPIFARMTERSTAVTGQSSEMLFMVSADHFGGRWPKFRQWYKWREILQYSGLLINQRPGNRINDGFITELKNINSHVFVVRNSDVVDVSSTEIRRGFDAKQAVAWLSPDVMTYVKEHSLY